MNLNDLIIDPVSIGKKLLLLDVKPIYEYQNGVKREDAITGYRYNIVCVDKGYDKVSVRIDGATPHLNTPDTPSEVVFDGLTIKAYYINGAVQIVMRATSVQYAKKGER